MGKLMDFNAYTFLLSVLYEEEISIDVAYDITEGKRKCYSAAGMKMTGEEISKLRMRGMTWESIGKKLGIHPTTAIARNKRYQEDKQ